MAGETCGLCRYTKAIPNDLTKRYCNGMPPFPVAIPGPRGIGIQMIRPVVGTVDEACALFKSRITLVGDGCNNGSSST